MHCPPPIAAVPSEDRPEGRGTGARGHPKASWQRVGGVHLTPHTPPLIEYAAVHPVFDAILLFWQQTSVEKHFKKNKVQTKKQTTSLTGRASTEVCKTVKVCKQWDKYICFFFRATHGSIVIQMCFGLKNSLWIWVWAFFFFFFSFFFVQRCNYFWTYCVTN